VVNKYYQAISSKYGAAHQTISKDMNSGDRESSKYHCDSSVLKSEGTSTIGSGKQDSVAVQLNQCFQTTFGLRNSTEEKYNLRHPVANS